MNNRIRTRRRPIGRDYAAAKDVECGIVKPGVKKKTITKARTGENTKTKKYSNFRV